MALTILVHLLLHIYEGCFPPLEDLPQHPKPPCGPKDRPVRRPIQNFPRPPPPAPYTGRRWYRPRHRKGKSTKDTLNRLPTELVLEIVLYLDPIDRASLALTGRRWLRLLGRASFDLQPVFRFELLVRLERDGVRPDDVLCPVCQVLHPAYLSLPPVWYFDRGLPTRGCARFRSSCSGELLEGNKVATPYLPLHLHFNTIATVMRNYRHGWKKYSADALTLSCRYDGRNGSPYPKLVSTTQCRIVQGRLVAKTENVILPCDGLAGLEASATVVEQLLDDEYVLRHCCGHLRWTTLHQHRLWSSQPISKTWPYTNRALPKVRSCSYCYTDYASSALDLPGDRGRVITLTTWKDLGEGYSINDPRWQSHLFPPTADDSILVDESEAGLAARAFEKKARTMKKGYYHPKVDAIIIKCLLNL